MQLLSIPPKQLPGLTLPLKFTPSPCRTPFALSLHSESPLTRIHKLKAAVINELGSMTKLENIWILYKKKPYSNSKSMKEILGDLDTEKKVEFTVIIIGGLVAPMSQQEANPGIRS